MFRNLLKLYITAEAAGCSNRNVVYRVRRGHTSAVQMVMVSPARVAPSPSPGAPPAPDEPPPRPPRRAPRAWTVAAAAAALGGGVLLYRRWWRSPATPPPAPDAGAPPGGPRSVPESASELPARTEYLLVGGGTASFSAFRAIRTAHPGARVLMVCAEDEVPYMRPPLTKQVWAAPLPSAVLEARAYPRAAPPDAPPDAPLASRPLAYEPPEYFTGEGVMSARGWSVVRLQPTERRATLQSVHRPDQRAEVEYEECLLASGSSPVSVPALSAVREYGACVRTAGGALQVARRLEGGARVVLVGEGPRAAELAHRLGAARWVASGPDPPPDAPDYLRDQLCPDEHVVSSRVDASGAGAGGAAVLCVSDGRGGRGEVRADLVVVCGAEEARPHPDWGLEEAPAGLGGGLLVGPELAARAHHYAAGDLANYYCVATGRRQRTASHDHAVHSGRLAGHNMAAALLARTRTDTGTVPPRARPYTHRPLVWAEPNDHSMETLGKVDGDVSSVGVWSEPGPPTGRGLVLYREGAPPAPHAPPGPLCGVMLWNVPDATHTARALLDLPPEQQADALELAKLFPLYDDDEEVAANTEPHSH